MRRLRNVTYIEAERNSAGYKLRYPLSIVLVAFSFVFVIT